MKHPLLWLAWGSVSSFACAAVLDLNIAGPAITEWLRGVSIVSPIVAVIAATAAAMARFP